MANPAACQVCEADDSSLLVRQGDFTWMQCRSCGFAFLDPMPDAEAGNDDAMGAEYIARYVRKLGAKMRRSRKRARRLARRMRGAAVLDVGSNIGLFAESCRRLGLTATGVEINATLVGHARATYPENEFLLGTIEGAGLEEGRFDGVYCSEVIEHVPDNNPFLAEIARVMKQGGVLFLTTPGLHEYVGGGEPGTWRDFGAPDHKLYYSRESIARMLGKHGFEDIRIARNFGRGIKLFARRNGNAALSPAGTASDGEPHDRAQAAEG